MWNPRAICGLIAIVVTVVITGCNKGKSLIDEAKAQRDAGKLTDALMTLHKVEDVAPGTPEVDQAKNLAVEWLLTEADKPDRESDRIGLLTEAVSWNPADGKARARLCVAYADVNNIELLRKCADELKGKPNVPADVPGRLQAALADMEKARAERDAKARTEAIKNGEECTSKCHDLWITCAAMCVSAGRDDYCSQQCRDAEKDCRKACPGWPQ
jgi:hypothetical protein